MSFKMSTGLVNAIAGETGFKGAMQSGVAYIYGGAQPATADAAPTGPLLAILTKDGLPFTAGSPTNGLTYADPVNASVSKSADTWKFTPVAEGTAGWIRFMGNAADNGGVSTTLPRFDGSVASAGGEVKLSTQNIVMGQPGFIQELLITFPRQ